MALRVVSLGTVTVTTAGSPVQLSANEIPAGSIIIQADQLNTGSVYIGDATVGSTDYELCPGQSLPITGENVRGISEGIFLSDIYVDAENNGNAVRILYLKRR